MMLGEGLFLMDKWSDQVAELADALAPTVGHHATLARSVKIFRAESAVSNIPKFLHPGILFVVQGMERLCCDVNVHIADSNHFLLTSAPLEFRIDTEAAAAMPLLAIQVAFDPATAMDIAQEIMRQDGSQAGPAAICQTCGVVDPPLRDLLCRLLKTLRDPVSCRILMPGLIRELHFLLLKGHDGPAVLAGLQGEGTRGKVLKTAAELLNRRRTGVSINNVAAAAEISISSYHSHFKALFGSTPLAYLKAARLHEARGLLKSADIGIAAVSHAVGYRGTSQFSREFHRYFGRTAQSEQKLLREAQSNLDLV
ncbi:DNA-binding domain-containing protein, AraC-type [Rhizobium leguminosarum bv. trifolii WSM597]|uniref:DNA-binding domain-containing protein, AraC-type n=1 Tax=Rhizobium leguminosarum bv. trifolii WSM597 TaxID=754764 RepID=J0HCK8_RHILT|nr:AraC family transcriptional regulator [Rhizobium leguminosarum]EJB08168.1 DNA-binding domain-containing protein, AraC-type [Rhizobium leguminosarum bv. trifolii WSM597]